MPWWRCLASLVATLVSRGGPFPPELREMQAALTHPPPPHPAHLCVQQRCERKSPDGLQYSTRAFFHSRGPYSHEVHGPGGQRISAPAHPSRPVTKHVDAILIEGHSNQSAESPSSDSFKPNVFVTNMIPTVLLQPGILL